MKLNSKVFFLLIIVGVIGFALADRFKIDFSDKGQSNRIAVVRLYGPIMDPEDTVLWLRRLSNEVEGLGAVVLAINTPGGGVAASQEIYSAIRRLRAKGIKVVASMGSVAASGGYYVACAADAIVAQPGTLTGSIGVIAQFTEASDLLNTVGLKFQVVKSGKYKDAGNPARAMTKDERRLFQGIIDDVYGQFVDAIVTERRGPLRSALARQRKTAEEALDTAALQAYVRSFADGRLISGKKALELGLVDQLGDMEDAIARAAKLAGMEEPEVVTRRQRHHWSEYLTGAAASLGTASIKSVIEGLEASWRRSPISLKAY